MESIEQRIKKAKEAYAMLEQQINVLIQQRNQIDQQLSLKNAEALKMQGRLDLLSEMIDVNPEEKNNGT